MYKKIICLIGVICVFLCCFGCKTKVDKELEKVKENKENPKVTEIKEEKKEEKKTENKVELGIYDPNKVTKTDETDTIREKIRIPITENTIITTKYVFKSPERKIPDNVLKEFEKYADKIPIAKKDKDCTGIWELTVLEQKDNVKIPVTTYTWKSELEGTGILFKAYDKYVKERHTCYIEIKADMENKIKKVHVIRDDFDKKTYGKDLTALTLLLIMDEDIKNNIKLPVPQSLKYKYSEELIESLEVAKDGWGIPVIPDAVIKEFEKQTENFKTIDVWKLQGPVKILAGKPSEHFVWMTELKGHGDKEKHWGYIEIVTDKDNKDVSYVKAWKKHITGVNIFYDEPVYEKRY